MKIVVAGSRTYKNQEHIYSVLNAVVQKSDILLQGGARGVDTIAATWARTHGVACRTFVAQWDEFGKAAGMRRNREMACVADALIAFWNGMSPGTGNMIRQMQLRKKPILSVRYDTQEELDLSSQFMYDI